jgi:hypothetical protein
LNRDRKVAPTESRKPANGVNQNFYVYATGLPIDKGQAMTLDKARELLQLQISLGSGYNRNSAKLILIEVQREHGQGAVDQLIIDLDLQQAFGFEPGTELKI